MPKKKKQFKTKCIVAYWYYRFEKETGYKHNQEIKRSKLMSVAEEILNTGLNVMLQNTTIDNEHTIVLWVDNSKFGQR